MRQFAPVVGVAAEEDHGPLREQLRLREATRGHVGRRVGAAPNRRPGALGTHPMHARGLVAAAIRQHTDGPAVMLVPVATESAAERQDQVRVISGPQKPRGRERGDKRLRRRRAAAG